MRNVLAAAVLAIPSMLSAQAMHTGISHLVASVDAPAFAFQASAINAVAPRVFSGLIAPVRLNSVQLAPTAVVAKGEVTVEFTVDAAGVPQNVEVVKPLNAAIDAQVVAAVSKIRYTPGKLDGQAVPMPVTMRVALNQ